MSCKIIFGALFLFLYCIVLVRGDLSLSSSTALVQEMKYYESTVDNAAQAVLRKLSKDKAITSSARVSKVDLEDTKVAESILYSIGLQMDVGVAMRGIEYEMQFIQPLSPWHSIRASSKGLPTSVTPKKPSTALTLHGSQPTYAPPEISLTLRGPMELYFPHATTELSIKTPRYVDVGFVDRIIVAEGANITLSGPAELRLRDSLSVDTSISVEDDKLVINTKDKARINVYGHRIEISNADGHLKVQKKSSSVVEISPSMSNTVVHNSHVPFEISLNDSRVDTVKRVLQQLSEQSNTPFPPRIRRISSGSRAEAVVSFLIPMEVEDKQAGTATMWDVVVVQGSNHKEAQVISVERQPAPRSEVTFAHALAMNGTLSSTFEDFQKYLQHTGRVL
jgi:hypothetical protein